jgi:hypothetical protein
MANSGGSGAGNVVQQKEGRAGSPLFAKWAKGGSNFLQNLYE